MTTRLVGVRTDYAQMPERLHGWIECRLRSAVVETIPRTGGMSPAVAASLRTATGVTAFVKAVAGHINPDTPSHFRHEMAVLSALPPAPYRPRLLDTYDDGDWVAILLEDVDGRHPDWHDLRERERVLGVVLRQSAELTPAPPALGPELGTVVTGLRTYRDGLDDPSDQELAALPRWAGARLDDLRTLLATTLDAIEQNAFCHWDVRHDNLLIRNGDGQPFILDWGMSRHGPSWGDVAVLGLEWAESPFFDELIDRLELDDEQDRAVTGFLVGIGTYLTMVATHPAPQGLPLLPAFRAELGQRCLIGARRRLDA